MLVPRLCTVASCAIFALLSAALPVATNTPPPTLIPQQNNMDRIFHSIVNFAHSFKGTTPKAGSSTDFPGPYTAWLFRSKGGKAGYLLIPIYNEFHLQDFWPSTVVRVFTVGDSESMNMQKFYNTLYNFPRFRPAFIVQHYSDFATAIAQADVAIEPAHLTGDAWFKKVWHEFAKVHPNIGSLNSI
ncbi:MAG: hypothetical protein M1829_000442 [Trizodia sp. TS-e1964]|nr:MAG: hypothetical protein M1829_000442 [Trizodia sp. TS-e1964]